MRARLPVAETFYSIQGEGPSAGVPALFLRTSYCNLRCPGWGPEGDMQGCDTGAVWRQIWRDLEPEEILEHWQEQGWLQRLGTPEQAHLILTGGEPLLWQGLLIELLRLLQPLNPFVEVETNGTVAPLPAFDAGVDRYNCSPKLRSAGNPFARSYRPEVLKGLIANPRVIFKFVIQDPVADLAEIHDHYLSLGIAPTRVWLMPEAADRARLIERSAEVMELAMAQGFRFSSRLHLIAWDQATGV